MTMFIDVNFQEFGKILFEQEENYEICEGFFNGIVEEILDNMTISTGLKILRMYLLDMSILGL